MANENFSTMQKKVMPEPRFLPGYTGHCPNIEREVGQTYGRATHTCLEAWPHDIERLSPMVPSDASVSTGGPTPVIMTNPPIYAPGIKVERSSESSASDDLKIVRRRMAREACPLLNDYMVPGYGGHVPVIRDVVGKNYQNACIEGIAKFDRAQQGNN